MKRTQIQLDDEVHAALRRLAYEQGRSIASIVRETLAKGFQTKRPKKRASLRSFPFVGAGRSEQKTLSPVSERHDEALAEVLLGKARRGQGRGR